MIGLRYWCFSRVNILIDCSNEHSHRTLNRYTTMRSNGWLLARFISSFSLSKVKNLASNRGSSSRLISDRHSDSSLPRCSAPVGRLSRTCPSMTSRPMTSTRRSRKCADAHALTSCRFHRRWRPARSASSTKRPARS